MATIVIELVEITVPSFKNNKRAVIQKGKKFAKPITDPKTKERMLHLENAMLSALYSDSQIIGNETHSECWKRLRTVLSGLSDDSVREIPSGSWDSFVVGKGFEGVKIEIMEIEHAP